MQEFSKLSKKVKTNCFPQTHSNVQRNDRKYTQKFGRQKIQNRWKKCKKKSHICEIKMHKKKEKFTIGVKLGGSMWNGLTTNWTQTWKC